MVVLDLYMPGMDGFEICRAIKSDERTRGTAVVAVTAHPSSESEKAIRDIGAEEYLAKPLDAEDLARLVSTLLRRALSSQPT